MKKSFQYFRMTAVAVAVFSAGLVHAQLAQNGLVTTGIRIGSFASSMSASNITIGDFSSAGDASIGSSDYSQIAIGTFAAVGQGALGGLAIGTMANVAADAYAATAIGRYASAQGARSLAIGGRSTAGGQQSTAIGDSASALGFGSVAIGSGSYATEDATVSFGLGGASGTGTPGWPNTRRLVNISSGINNTDAVNVQQLNVVRDAAATAQTTADGAQTTAGTALVNAATAQSTASTALVSATAAQVTAVAAQGTANTALSTAATAQTTATAAAATATDAKTTAVAAQGSATAAHARIDQDQAVLANHETRIDALENRTNQQVNALDKKASSGIAAALATTAAMPAGVDLEPGEVGMNIGVGAFSSQAALAVGFAHRLKSENPLVKNALVRGALSHSGGQTGVSVGIGWKF